MGWRGHESPVTWASQKLLGNRHVSIKQGSIEFMATLATALILGLSPTVRLAATSRRGLLAAAAASLPLRGLSPADAAVGPAVDLVVQIGELSTQARTLQDYVRSTAPTSRATGRYISLQREVSRVRRQLQRLLATMTAAAPDLKICSPELADCDCAPDPRLMQVLVPPLSHR